MIDSQFYMEQLLKPENSLRTTGFEPVPSDCEQEDNATLWEAFKSRDFNNCSI